ncbi:damage-inducible protein CinA [Sedimentitalea sp. CY04]|uniref:Damage-inducible protein CinA n=1 Tax=Parasedimentitalea denitrificans TaxID=2211118 RepID=A0ABX0W9J4_9RHOB|nr:CinA family protein [Sedimentitalea sp. CY04]NIZ60826.1 damage-inducible protein CinA [Sedimentitalea sp. CY04]
MDIADLIAKATATGVTIAAAESCTGGLVAAALTDIPGSSAVFDRGFITYSNAAKADMLGVSNATLSTFGAVSEEVAKEMSLGALHNSNATIAVSVTGIAGPGGSDHKPEGRVCFGIAMLDQPPATETVEFGPMGRTNVRLAARDHALDLLRQAIRQTSVDLRK